MTFFKEKKPTFTKEQEQKILELVDILDKLKNKVKELEERSKKGNNDVYKAYLVASDLCSLLIANTKTYFEDGNAYNLRKSYECSIQGASILKQDRATGLEYIFRCIYVGIITLLNSLSKDIGHTKDWFPVPETKTAAIVIDFGMKVNELEAISPEEFEEITDILYAQNPDDPFASLK